MSGGVNMRAKLVVTGRILVGLVVALVFLGVPAAVVDPPVLTLPSDFTVEATGPSGAVATYTVTATDDFPNPELSCSPPSGSTFPLGTTTVTCTASDAANNTSSGSFSVTVHDTTPPVVTVPGSSTVEATGPGGATVSYSGASAADAVSGSLTPTCAPASGSTSPLGTT